MAESSETCALVDNADDDTENAYLNMGYGSTRGRKESTASTIREDSCFQTVDELLFRIKYAALDPEYNVEADLKAVLQNCSEDDIARLLQELNALPLKIHQKLKVCKVLHSEGYLKRRYKTGKASKMEKRRDVSSMFQAFSLWDDTIAKLTAYFGSNVSSYFRFVRSIVYMNLFTAVLLVGFITVPKMVDGNFKSNITFGGHFGELSDSIMFYGLYTNDLTFSYNLPVAYFLTWLAVNLMCFVYIITLMIIQYKKSKLLTEKGSEYKFAWRTFCTWDYSITSRQGVMDHRTSLRTDLKELVRDEQSTCKVSTCTRLTRYAGRLFSNVIVIGILVGSGLLIYTMADKDIIPETAPESIQEFFRKYQLTVVVAGLKFIVPPLFQQLVKLEGWHPRTETKFTLARTTVFYIASLMVFVLSLYNVTVSQSCNDETDPTFNTTTCCWENDVGEEVFKVILLDMGILIAVGVIFHMCRALVVKHCYRQIGYSKFDVVACVLDVIYGQSLVWLGLYFSPLLGVAGFIKLVLVFYIRLIIAKIAMVPPQQLFRASSTGNFYLAILLLNLFVSLFPMAYAVIEVKPSIDCGPFSGKDRSYRVISDIIGDLPDWLEDILNYIGTPAIMVPLIILLVLSTIFFNVKFTSYKGLTEELRKQLIFERRVEKRKIFATGKAMSGAGSLSRHTSQESLISNFTQPGTKYRQPPDDTIIEEHDM